jgi:hypothetical protein
MDGASFRDMKCGNAGKVTTYMVDLDIDVRKDSTEMEYKLLPFTSWPLDIVTFSDRK